MSILEKLEREKIFSFTKTNEGFEFLEMCDLYYKVVLTKEEVLQLAEELKELAEQLK